ncbi:MAG: hypothetical protein KGN80_10345 [Acidobacteriota bacterium]|nr:hypothetical protein [Acidobacteriota bacterium]
MKSASCIATVFLGIVALAHLFRVVFRLNIQVGSFSVPPWMSLVAFLFCGVLAILLFKESKGK